MSLTDLERIFGATLLALLLGVSSASLHRYGSGRLTSDLAAGRVHFLTTVVGELAGTYDDIGIRRWFERPRHNLDGRSPAELLSGDWDPDDAGPRRVRELARALSGLPAT